MSQDKFKTLNFHYQKAFSHQTCKGCDALLGAPTYKVTGPFNSVILYGYMES